MPIRKRAKLNFNPSHFVDGLPRPQMPRALEQVPRALEQVPRALEQVPRPTRPRVVAPRIFRPHIIRPHVTLRSRGGTASDALLRAQLARTSRQLAHESSDLGQTVDSLKSTVSAERRKSLVARRRRLTRSMTLGAVLMYHLDPTSGRNRRAATGHLLKSLVGGVRSLTSSSD
jgi:hypothetical protein